MTDETRRQGARLRALRERRGWSKSHIASRLGFEATQSLELYERGKSIIRLDQLQLWADAYEMTVVDFTNAVFNGATADIAWNFRAALRGYVPEPLIDRLAPQWEGRPLLNQQAAAEAIREMWDEHVREVTLKPLGHANAG